MIGLRITTKRELDLWKATILDLRQECQRMRQERDHERERAEGAINALLARAARVALPMRGGMDIENQIDRQTDIFNEENQDREQAKLLEEMQS